MRVYWGESYHCFHLRRYLIPALFMNIVGISCFYHDAAACLVQDGKLIAAAQEERFTRIKNCENFPYNAINFCLQAANITVADVDYMVFYEKPYLKFYRVILNHVRSYPFSLRNFLATLPDWLQDRLILPLVANEELAYAKDVLFIKHHLSHAAGAFLISPFEKAMILTADGIGEWAAVTYGYGEGNRLKVFRELQYPNSLGLFYTAVATYLGFEALTGEGKVMGLASYGEPVYVDRLKEIIHTHDDGSFSIDERYLSFNRGTKMFNRRFSNTFGAPRRAGEAITARDKDMAASLQALVEEIVLRIVRNIYKEMKCERLCLGGGVFLNCVLNHKILEHTDIKEVFIQPASGDSGGALGAAYYVYNTLLNNPRNFILDSPYWGPEFSPTAIRTALVNNQLNFTEMDDDALFRFVAEQISRDKIIGWFQGRMEVGPRALGNRSILANPCNPSIKALLNERVKKRESFRPYAPVVLEEEAGAYFELKQESPFMLLAAKVKPEKATLIPGVTHVDGTARVQTVSESINPRLWRLIKAFKECTGVPVLLNTSFNLRGEPIVCTPDDAINDFLKSKMDYLVLENFVVQR